MSKVQIIVMRPAPYILAPIFEWKEITAGTGLKKMAKGKQLFPMKTLMPGGGQRNLIDVNHWEALKNHRGVKLALKHGIIAEADPEQAVPAQYDPESLIRYQTVEAAGVAIDEENDLERLQGWFKQDKRPEVQASILKRLRELTQTDSDTPRGDGA